MLVLLCCYSHGILAESMEITVEDIPANHQPSTPFICNKNNVRPEFLIKNIPLGTHSLALTLKDLDTPLAPFIHWIIWNLPATVTNFSTQSVPVNAVEGKNSRELNGYTPLCPPKGQTHHYQVMVYALNTVLSADATANYMTLMQWIDGHVLESATWVGVYSQD
jgi:Raf kinase inhibitor-like YbhB/YbcL family protein